MAKSTAKKTTRKSTAKTTARKTTATRTDNRSEETLSIGQRPCAYPSCSARANQEVSNVPTCDHHAEIFETQANDGAGIQQIVEGYKGP